MSSYTITIAADDPSRATTTLRIELDGTAARITELLVRAGERDGLSAGRIPAVDLDLLLKAVTPAVAGQQAITVSPATDDATGPAGVDDEAPVATPETVEAFDATASAADLPATVAPAASDLADVAVPKQASRAKTPATGATRVGGRRAEAGSKARKGGRKTGKQATMGKTPEDTGRVYRRAPGDLESVYQQAGSVAAIADHYNVPRHTAQGWIRTLRRRQARSVE